jgi:hypothetical protein
MISRMAIEIQAFRTLLAAVIDERFGGNVTVAAKAAQYDRGNLSRILRDDLPPPELKRLADILNRWGVRGEKAEQILQAARYRKMNKPGREFVERLGVQSAAAQGGASVILHPRRKPLILLMTPGDAAPGLYREFTPLEGSFSESAGLLASEDDVGDNEREFLCFGPVPEGSIAVRIDEDVECLPREFRGFAVFGPAQKPSGNGAGLFEIKGEPPVAIVRFHAEGHDVTIYRGHEANRLPAPTIRSFRPFIAAV